MKRGACDSRKPILFPILFILFLCGAPSPAVSQWQALPAEGGSIHAIHQIGSEQLIGLYGGGVFRSSDLGGHWRRTPADAHGGADSYVEDFTHDATHCYAATWDGVQRAALSGASWEQTALTKFTQRLHAENGMLVAACRWDGIYVSSDRGDSWEERNAGLTSKAIVDMAVAWPLIVVLSGDGVFLSTNGGVQWQSHATKFPGGWVGSVAARKGKLYVGNKSKIYISTNAGGMWNEVFSGAQMAIPRIHTFGNSGIIVGGEGVIYLSTDDGVTWNTRTSRPGGGLVSALWAEGNTILTGDGYGIRKSMDGGITWMDATTGLHGAMVNDFLEHPVSADELYALLYSGGLFRSSDGGGSWQRSAGSGEAIERIGSTLFKGEQYGGVKSSTDGGAMWDPMSATSGWYVFDLTAIGNSLFAGTGFSGPAKGVYVSTDMGQSWQERNSGLLQHYVTVVYTLHYDGITLFAGTSKGGLFASTNVGATWSARRLPDTTAAVYDIAIAGSSLFVATSKGVYRSDNKGLSWSSASNGMGNVYGTALATSGSKVFAGTSLQGIYVSTDNGNSWVEANEGLDWKSVGALTVQGQFLYAGMSGGGIWKRPVAEMPSTAPRAPVLVSPADNTTDLTAVITFIWNTSDGADSYDLQVSESSSFVSTVINQTGITSTSSTANLPGGKTYYWRVRAHGTGGTSVWSATWSFSTQLVLAAPTLLSPAENSTGVGVPVNFDWGDVPGASQYELQVSLTPSFLALVWSDSALTVSQTSVSGLQTGETYYWRVRAKSGALTGPWSYTWFFETSVPTLPETPTLQSPANAASEVQLPLTVRWNSAQRATGYDVQLSERSDFQSMVFERNTANTSLPATGLSLGKQYYWRVRGTNSNGASGWSTVWSFTTSAGEPQLAVIPQNLPFGNVKVGSSARLTVEVRNTGTGILTLGSQIIASGGTSFRVITPALAGIYAGGSSEATLEFQPQQAGMAQGTFVIASNDSDTPTMTVNLTGTGVVDAQIELSAQVIDFGSVDAGKAVDSVVTIYNIGGADLILTYTGLSDFGPYTDPGDFAIVQLPSRQLTPSEETKLRIRLASTASSQHKEAHFKMMTNDPSHPDVDILIRADVLTHYESPAAPDAWQLSQNYPNPFAESAIVEYALPEAAFVELSVYDLFGRKLSTILRGHMEPGMHTVRIEAPGLPAGQYYYRLESGTRTLVRIMTILQ